MTFSIVVRDADAATWGVAVASKFLAVGAFVPAAAPGAGALATQADVNLTYRPDGLTLLSAGVEAPAVVRTLVDADERGSHRQLGVVDADGEAAAWTGEDCIAWAGHRTGAGVSVQGNCLTGPEVVDAMLAAWEAGDPSTSLGDRLVAALAAGDAAGGDARGRQSAAVLVVRERGGFMETPDVVVDLRVDAHETPTTELVRLMTLHHLHLERPDPADLVEFDDALRTRCDALARAAGQPDFDTWVGVSNYEMRVTDTAIDRTVLSLLEAGAQRTR
jgi:uncharacterized Ntn-hydrolase superfamily protein